ncbi:TPA: DUF1972 domain-containing protein [Enterococcus faecium]|nr:DUF1972 domain-containing protein [Enterococcus faecium]MCU4679264.1 DUF1972 domain-containing protein [Enterococcus faecium]MDT2331854.1 DUF1972 domain-containing protein [Enterococcus faecium]MDT2362901.1 DUF1972 domain-containing protein [Enterococcus faecium]MDV7756412.1 DUF1972 domain-containing protein [Enterococcus faecium]
MGPNVISEKYCKFKAFLENFTKRQTDKIIQYHITCTD